MECTGNVRQLDPLCHHHRDTVTDLLCGLLSPGLAHRSPNYSTEATEHRTEATTPASAVECSDNSTRAFHHRSLDVLSPGRDCCAASGASQPETVVHDEQWRGDRRSARRPGCALFAGAALARVVEPVEA